jgi:hypothetical protein
MSPRRDFLKSVALAGLAPAALASPQTPTPSPSPAQPLAEALTEAARVRFGAYLQPGDVEVVRKSIEENLAAAEKLRALKLGNADEPVTVFQARPPKA